MNIIPFTITLTSLLLTTGVAVADGMSSESGVNEKRIECFPPSCSSDKAVNVKSTEKKTEASFDITTLTKSHTKTVPPKELNLPGVVKLDGASPLAFDPIKSHKISWGNQGVIPVKLTQTGPNLIVTPFNDPYVVGNSYLNVNKRAFTNNVYIEFMFPAGVKPYPMTIFIEDPEGGMPIGLELHPTENIPTQTYVIVNDTKRADGIAKTKTDASSKDYIKNIQDLMEISGKGGIPDGFSSTNLAIPPIIFNELLLSGKKRLSGRDGDIYIYQVTNPTTESILLKPDEFDGPNVKAVSIVPKPLLDKNESATVLVYANRAKETK